MEFSWALRDFAGESISCDDAKISTVSLCWRDAEITGETTCSADASRDFVCDREQGATAFEVPPGRQTLWLEVTCASSQARAEASAYDVPAPIVRTVTDGSIVTLNSLLIVATRAGVTCDGRMCTCPP